MTVMFEVQAFTITRHRDTVHPHKESKMHTKYWGGMADGINFQRYWHYELVSPGSLCSGQGHYGTVFAFQDLRFIIEIQTF